MILRSPQLWRESPECKGSIEVRLIRLKRAVDIFSNEM